jgi:hypothetical protein
MLGRDCFTFIAREAPVRMRAGRITRRPSAATQVTSETMRMARVAILTMAMVTLLAGCGQVILFGHVVGEKSASEPEPPAASVPAPADSTQPSAGGAARPPTLTGAEPVAKSASIGRVVRAVNITITPEAAAKITGDASRFTSDALLAAIKTELTSRKLLDAQDPQATGTAEVVIDDIATRPTSNAVLFGYKMLAGTLEGDIRITDSDGTDSTGSRIIAESKLTLAVSGEDKNPLGPLYKRFAVLAGDRLAGVASKPQDLTGPPRF